MPTMHDVTPNTTQQHNVTVQQAARLLGITDEAVRARIRRGKLVGEKRGSTWVVSLSDEAGQEPTQQDTTEHSTQQTEQTQQNARPDQDDLVEHLRGEVTYLRERLENAMGQLEAERQRADVLQLRAIGTGETPTTSSEAPGSPRGDDQPVHGLRAWWRRLWGF